MAFKELDEDADGGSANGRRSRPNGRRMVAAVGVTLIVLSALGPVSNCGFSMVLVSIYKSDEAQPPPGVDRVNWQRGRDAAPGLQHILFGLVSLIYIPVLIGGLKLRNAQGRGIGFTAAVIVMLPVSPAFLAGLPIGVWALVVLNRPEVIEAMNRRRRQLEDDEYDDRPRRRHRRDDEEEEDRDRRPRRRRRRDDD